MVLARLMDGGTKARCLEVVMEEENTAKDHGCGVIPTEGQKVEMT